MLLLFFGLSDARGSCQTCGPIRLACLPSAIIIISRLAGYADKVKTICRSNRTNFSTPTIVEKESHFAGLGLERLTTETFIKMRAIVANMGISGVLGLENTLF